ncbi:hypothetical protein QYF61_023356 [Mycteria americana]|uniref:Epg5-like central TPR repeats domain-containing protein n=1 Tax=Mycteria americana TaxID=33587 RepID=A0AAN7MQZ5_MYCAM|nr:hypothetical protein QYF61_023356 [Mycteria americana]
MYFSKIAELDKLLPSYRGALWSHLMHYCECCTAPKMPEFILYTLHTEFRRLPWKEMHPDQMLMEEFLKIERGSPKSCFLFLGYVLCEINWVGVLSDAWNPNPHPQTHNMIVCLLYMMVLLAKEEQLIGKEELPFINLLGQTSSIPWQLVGISSYQSIISYCNSYYPPSVILAKDAAAELIVKLLKISAGFGASSDSHIHLGRDCEEQMSYCNFVSTDKELSSAKEEAKLFLWWHKAMQLSLIQMEQDDTILIESVVRTLLSIQGRRSQLAEERLSSEIFRAFWLGRRSPLSPRFRVVARSLFAVFLVQIPAESQVCLKAGSEPKLLQKAQQALNALESMASNKQYMDYQEQLSQASQFIKHPEHCLRDGNNLLALLINTLYPEVRYLDSIRWQH